MHAKAPVIRGPLLCSRHAANSPPLFALPRSSCDHHRVEPLLPSPVIAPAARARAASALLMLILGYAAALSIRAPALAWAIASCLFAALSLGMTWRAQGTTPGDRRDDQARPSRHLSILQIALLMLAWTMLSAAWCTVRVESPAADFVRAIDPLADPSRILAEGVVLDDPRQSPDSLDPLERFRRRAPRGACTLSLRAIQVDAPDAGKASGSINHTRIMTPASGTIRVSIPGSTYSGSAGLAGFPCKAGDRVRLIGSFRPIAPAMNPGEDRWASDPVLLANQDGRVGSMVVPDLSLVTVLENTGLLDRAAAPLRRLLANIRARSLAILDPGPTPTPAPDAAALGNAALDQHMLARAFILSLLLGDDPSGQREVSAMFARAGLSHVLAISGVHVAVVVALGLFLLRALREPGRIEPLIVALLVAAYLVLVPAQAPVVRSGALAITLALARFAGRRYDPLPLLLWASIALALWRPLDVWSLGYQLSVGLAALLVWKSRNFADRLFLPHIRGVVDERPRSVRLGADAARHLVSSTVLCSVVGAPAIWCATGRVSLAAIPAALAALPLVAILMHAGYAVLIAGLLVAIASPGIAAGLGAALLPLAHWCVSITAFFESFPHSSLSLAAPGTPWAITATIVALWVLLTARWRSPQTWAAVALIVAWGAAGSIIARSDTPRQPVDEGFENARKDRWCLQTLALREGVCTIVKANGRCVLFNAGAGDAWSGARTIERAMVSIGAPTADRAILARPDLEHAGAVHALWSQGRVQAWAASPSCAKFLTDETTPMPTLGRALGPPAGADAGDPIAWEPLDDGAAVRFTLGKTRVLLATGLTRPELRRLLDSNADLRADVLELPHATGVWRECKELVKRSAARVVIQTDPPHVARDPDWDSAKQGRVWIATALQGSAMVQHGPDGTIRATPFIASTPQTRGSRSPGAGP